MIDQFSLDAGRAIFDKIRGDPAMIRELTDAELTLARGFQQTSGVLIATTFFVAADRDHAVCQQLLDEALALDLDRLVKRASRGADRLAAGKGATLAQYAALLVVGRGEHMLLDAEAERREAERSGSVQ